MANHHAVVVCIYALTLISYTHTHYQALRINKNLTSTSGIIIIIRNSFIFVFRFALQWLSNNWIFTASVIISIPWDTWYKLNCKWYCYFLCVLICTSWLSNNWIYTTSVIIFYFTIFLQSFIWSANFSLICYNWMWYLKWNQISFSCKNKPKSAPNK